MTKRPRKFYTLGFAPEHKMGKGEELDSHNLNNFCQLKLTQATPLSRLPDGIELYLARKSTDKIDFDVVANGMGWKIVSSRLAACVRAVTNNDIELLPIKLKCNDGYDLPEIFFVINALKMLDAISEKKTIRSTVKIGADHPVIKLAIVAGKIPSDVHMFRVTGWEFSLLVDDVFKKALKDIPHDGLVFIPVQTE